MTDHQPITAEAAERAALAVAKTSRPTTHSQLCPVWTRKTGIDKCDCWILTDARRLVDVAVTELNRTPAAPPPCCDLHNEHCEPPSELCCEGCTETGHPEHRDGRTCVLDGAHRG